MKNTRIRLGSLLCLQIIAVAAGAASLAHASSAPELKQVSFEGRTRIDAASTRYFKIKVGRADGTDPASPLLATFHNSKGSPVAHCRITLFEKTRARSPKHMGMDCTSLQPGLVGPDVALAWEKTGVALKLGNWLSGTQSLEVEVERDAFSSPNLMDRPTQLALNTRE